MPNQGEAALTDRTGVFQKPEGEIAHRIREGLRSVTALDSRVRRGLAHRVRVQERMRIIAARSQGMIIERRFGVKFAVPVTSVSLKPGDRRMVNVCSRSAKKQIPRGASLRTDRFMFGGGRRSRRDKRHRPCQSNNPSSDIAGPSLEELSQKKGR